jgi:glutamate-5-semialdehyde dehydrogenase
MKLKNTFESALEAGRQLNLIDGTTIDSVLLKVADATENNADYILTENSKDLALMDKANPVYDRLLLTRERIAGIASDLRNVASLHSPLGEILSSAVRPNGMKIEKIRVPFGVVGVIYEARPNVSFDVFGLCFKTKNASLLKGSGNAHHSNTAIAKIIREVLKSEGINPDVVTLLPADREATAEMLGATAYIDLIIPRGSSSLINFVRDNSRVPVIETGAGICHTYFDKTGDITKGEAIIFNAKTRRVSVCNALDCLIIHNERLEDLPLLCGRLASKNVIIQADERSYVCLEGNYPSELLQRAGAESFGMEFLDYKMSIKTVDSLQGAIEHITRYSSKHSEAIVSEDKAVLETFASAIDAACVYLNVSTAFTDGAQFGLGAEIGISTQKLHARGPMALSELTSYKYVIHGDGQVRSS